MSRFHTLEVTDVRQETRDAISIAFAVPEALQDDYRYREGQHLVLRSEIDGEEVRRSYSICSSPADKELRIAVKRISGGLFSMYLNTPEMTEADGVRPSPAAARPVHPAFPVRRRYR